MSAAKDKGTRAENAVVEYLRKMGFKHAERRTLAGKNDRGDIAGIPGLVIEVKDCQRMELAAWIAEAIKEADGQMGVVWHKRRGKASPGDWYVTMDGFTFVDVLMSALEGADK